MDENSAILRNNAIILMTVIAVVFSVAYWAGSAWGVLAIFLATDVQPIRPVFSDDDDDDAVEDGAPSSKNG